MEGEVDRKVGKSNNIIVYVNSEYVEWKKKKKRGYHSYLVSPQASDMRSSLQKLLLLSYYMQTGLLLFNY